LGTKTIAGVNRQRSVGSFKSQNWELKPYGKDMSDVTNVSLNPRIGN